MSENKASTGLVIKLVLTGLVTGLIVPLTAAIWLFFKHKQVDVTLFFNQELMPVFVATPFITAFVGFISAIGVQKQFKRIFNLLSRQKQIVQSVTVFAEKIGTGDLNAEFQPSGDEDMLGKAILNMRENLVKANIEEENRNWIVTGVAEVGGIVRNNTELKGLGDAMVSYLTKKLNAVQAGFYVINDNDPSDVYLEMLSSFAYNRMKRLKAKFYFGQGLVGQAAIEQDTIYRTEIPNDYVTITSGLLGDQKPKAILIVPLITNEKVYGVIELASFERFNPTHIKYVQQLSDILARTIFNININAKTKALLEESQQMSIALGEQTAQLEQNAEEMRATQEELQRNNVQLEYTVQEVIRGQQRTQVLLENASEVINIYDENGNITYASPSIKNILGYEPDELVGKSGNNIVHQDGVEIMNKMFADLIAKPEESITVQYPGLRPNGEIVWLESTGRNLVNDPAIQGILFNTIDITERLMAEKEQRERAKMQALSENSPDIILRFDLLRKISYCNPTIEKFTGLNEIYFRGQHISELKINPEIIEKWKFFIDEIELNKTVRINNIYYDYNKADLRPTSLPELDKLIHFLHANPTLVIEISSHTDARGNDEYNLDLSGHRAESVVKYLIANGIPKARLVAKGYGETVLIVPSASTEEEHQMNRRTEFKVLKIK